MTFANIKVYYDLIVCSMIYSYRLCKVYINLLPLWYFKIFPLLSANICGRGRFIAISLHITVILNVILKGWGNIFHIGRETLLSTVGFDIFLLRLCCKYELVWLVTMINSGFMCSTQLEDKPFRTISTLTTGRVRLPFCFHFSVWAASAWYWLSLFEYLQRSQ